jgi:hypothetical protein
VATMKIKYFSMYLVACFAGYYSGIPGLGLVLMGIWMQIANLLWLQLTHASWVGQPESKSSQIFYFRYFIFSIPIILIFGSINSFFSIFWKNFDVLKLVSLNSVQFICSFLLCVFLVFNFSIYKEESSISLSLVKTLKNLKPNLKLVLNITLIFWILNFLSLVILNNEYFLVINYALIHLYFLYWTKTRPVVVRPD